MSNIVASVLALVLVEPSSQELEARRAYYEERPPVAVVTRTAEHHFEENLAFYRVPQTPGGAPYIAIRRYIRNQSDGRPQVTTVTSKECPAARSAYNALGRLELPRIDFEPRHRANLGAAGQSFSLWIALATTRSRSASVVEIRSLGPSPTAEWYAQYATALDRC